MYRRCMAFILALPILLFVGQASAQQAEKEQAENAQQALQEGMEEILSQLDLEALEEIYQPEAFGGQTLKEAIHRIAQQGLTDLSAEQALNAVFQALLNEFAGNWRFAAEILGMLLLMSLLRNMNSSFGGEISSAAFYAGYITVAGIAVAILSDCVHICSNAIATLGSVIEGVAPVVMIRLRAWGRAALPRC